MANWSDIPQEIVRKIATEHVESLEDFESLAEVSSECRDALKGVKFCPSKNKQHPWLMLVDSPTSSYRRLYSLSKHMFRKFDLPQLEDDDHHRFFSSTGWLTAVSRRNRNITLFDPISGKVIKPPSVSLSLLLEDNPWDDISFRLHFFKFILTGWPSCCNDDVAVAMIFDAFQRLAVWKPGEQKWTIIPTMYNWVYDVCFFKGEFYAIDHVGEVLAFGIEVAKRKPRIVVSLINQGVILKRTTGKFYLVEAESTLLVIHRYVHVVDDDELECLKIDEPHYWTTHFEIYELDVDNGKAKKVEGVGDRAIFIGLGSSTFSVDASLDKCGCKANCIYFTDDSTETYYGSQSGGGSDMGIYSLAEGKIIERFYEGPSQFCFITPPIWVERPYYCSKAI